MVLPPSAPFTLQGPPICSWTARPRKKSDVGKGVWDQGKKIQQVQVCYGATACSRALAIGALGFLKGGEQEVREEPLD